MTTRNLLSAAALGIILTGCAYPLPRIASTEDCNGQHCEVAVSAKPHDTLGFSCIVDRVAPYELEVRHARPVVITFRMDTGSANAGYRFAQNGIVFDDPNGWNCPATPPSATQLQCTNTAGPGRHKYTVNLTKGSARCEPYDPYIVNQ